MFCKENSLLKQLQQYGRCGTYQGDTGSSRGDPDVLDYVVRSLEEGDFGYGEHGQEAYDAFEERLVSTAGTLVQQ